MSLQFLNHRILMFFFTEMCFDLKRVIKLVFISQKNQKAVFLSILILKQQSVLSQLEQTVYFVKKNQDSLFNELVKNYKTVNYIQPMATRKTLAFT